MFQAEKEKKLDFFGNAPNVDLDTAGQRVGGFQKSKSFVNIIYLRSLTATKSGIGEMGDGSQVNSTTM